MPYVNYVQNSAEDRLQSFDALVEAPV